MKAVDIQNELKKALQGDKLEILKSQNGFDGWWKSITQIIQGDGLVINNCSINDESEFVIVGDTASFGTEKIEIELRIEDSDKGIKFTSDFQLLKERQISIPGCDWLSIDNIYINLIVDGDKESGWVTGDAHISELKLLMKLDYPISEDEWIYSIACNDNPIDLEMAKSILGVKNLAFLPAGLGTVINNISLAGLKINFNPAAQNIKWVYLAIKFTVPEDWQLTPNWIKLKDFQLNVGAHLNEKKYVGSIAGRANIGKTEVEVIVTFGDQNCKIQFGASSIQLPRLTDVADLICGHDISGQLPDSLKNIEGLELYDILIDYDFTDRKLKKAQFKLGFNSEEDIPLLPSIALQKPTLSVTANSSNGAMQANVTLESHCGIGDAKGYIFGKAGTEVEKLTLEGILTDVTLSKLVKKLLGQDVELPIVSDVTLLELAVTTKPFDQYLKIESNISAAGNLPIGDGTHIEFTSIGFLFEQGDQTPLNCKITANGSCKFADGLEIENFSFEFNYDKLQGWTLNTDVKILLLSSEQSFNVSYKSKEKLLHFSYKPTQPIKVFGFDGMSFSLINASLDIKNGSESIPQFEFSGKAQLKLGDKLDITGNLELGTEKGIVFCFDAPDKPLEIPIPEFLVKKGESKPTIAFKNASIGIIPFKEEDGTVNGWCLEGGLLVQFLNFPTYVQQALPKEDVNGKMTISKKGFSVSVDNVLSDREITLPPIPLSKVQLKSLLVNAKNLTISFDLNGDCCFSFEPMLKLPKGINGAIFGYTGKDGKGPERDILVTGEDLSCRIKMGYINKELGFTFELISSPFMALPIKNGKWPLDLGTVGLINIEVPHFQAGTKGFSAIGGFAEDEERPLTLPLTFFKSILKDRIPDTVYNFIPDGLPLLKKPKLISGLGKLDVDELVKHLEQNFGNFLPEHKVPELLIKALNEISAIANNLPERLVEYLEADLPNNFHFEINADSSGSLTADIRTQEFNSDGNPSRNSEDALKKEGRPIMVLFPTIPYLVGLRLSNLQIGPIFGGSLIMVRVNAEIDIFDPMMLEASIAAAVVPSLEKWLPGGKKVHTTVQMHDVVILIAYEAAGIPIPVPVFYEQLGINMARPGGLELATSISFNPLTHNDLSSVFGTVSELYKFISDKQYSIEPKNGIQLNAHIGKTYFQLPAFLGSGVLGDKDNNLFDINFSEIFANFLNGLKFFSLSTMIKGIPLEYRCGAANPKFFFIKLNGAYAITTRAEFKEGLRWVDQKNGKPNALVGLSEKDRTEVLTVLDKAPDTNDDAGWVLLLAGECKLDSFLTMGGRFGIVTAGQKGFSTGVQFYGDILNRTVGFKINGLVYMDLTKKIGDGVAGFRGDALLIVNGAPTAKAEVTISDKEIGFKVAANLFPKVEQIKIKGELAVSISKEKGFFATASGEVQLFNSRMDGTVTVTGNSVRMDGELKFGELTFSMYVYAEALNAENHASISLKGEVENLSATVLSQAASELIGLSIAKLNELLNAIKAGRANDANKWWWNKTHTDIVWSTQQNAINDLIIIIKSTGVVTSVVSQIISLLPGSFQKVINAIVSQTNKFEVTSATIDTKFSTALKGDIIFNFKGKYANNEIKHLLQVHLDVNQNPGVLIAKSLAKAVIG